MTTVTIPGLRLDVTANSRLHWATRARRVKRQRAVVALVLRTVSRTPIPCVVIITRQSRGTLDDDNAVSSAKAVRDEIATWLGLDDRDPRVTWEVRQERAPWGVRIDLRPRGADPTPTQQPRNASPQPQEPTQ